MYVLFVPQPPFLCRSPNSEQITANEGAQRRCVLEETCATCARRAECGRLLRRVWAATANCSMWGVHDVKVAAVNHCLGLDWDLGFGLVIWALLGQM
ncbi:hypothetical protein V6Z11_D05G372700 [Gossypium hirsutum]